MERRDDGINCGVVEDYFLLGGHPRLVLVTEDPVRDRSLELERATKHDDAMQYTRIDAKERFECLDVAIVLPERILKPELLLEVNCGPVRVGIVREEPARPILYFNDEDPKLRHDEVVDFRRTARSRNDDLSKMVIVRTAELKRPVAEKRPESAE
jgi:hypothetical protein